MNVEDRLRDEYFGLLSEIELVAAEIEIEICHALLPIRRDLGAHERLSVVSRVKQCPSAIGALRRRQEGREFSAHSTYSLIDLKDLAAARVLVFPRKRIPAVVDRLREKFPDWESDPVLDANDPRKVLAEKYSGYCDASQRICAEYQVASALLGSFWDIEHDTLYKPAPRLRAVGASHYLRDARALVLSSLDAFEAEFERFVDESDALQP